MFSLSSMCFRDSEDQHPCFSNSLSSSSWATHAKGLKSVMKADMVTNLSSSNVGSVTHCQPAWPPLWTWVCFAGSIHHAAIRRPKHLEPLKGSICGPRSKPAALVEVHPSPILWGLCVYGRKRNPSPSLFSENRWKKKHFPVLDVPHSIHPNHSGHIS